MKEKASAPRKGTDAERHTFYHPLQCTAIHVSDNGESRQRLLWSCCPPVLRAVFGPELRRDFQTIGTCAGLPPLRRLSGAFPKVLLSPSASFVTVQLCRFRRYAPNNGFFALYPIKIPLSMPIFMHPFYLKCCFYAHQKNDW